MSRRVVWVMLGAVLVASAAAATGCCCPIAKPVGGLIERVTGDDAQDEDDGEEKGDPTADIEEDAVRPPDYGGALYGADDDASMAAYDRMADLGAKKGFTVWRPTWLPEGFAVSEAEQSDDDVSLVVEYADGDRRVVVAQLVGDLGEDKADSAVAWGPDGQIASLYADYPYWSPDGSESGEGFMAYYGATSPSVMLSTRGLDETDVLRIVTQMEKVSP